MSEMAKTFEKHKKNILLEINTLAPAKVLSYNPNTHRADLQPLFLMADESGVVYKQSPINDAPVLRHCQDDIRVGCLVFYMCAQRSLADLNGTNFIDPDSEKFFSDNDAVVVGVFDG